MRPFASFQDSFSSRLPRPSHGRAWLIAAALLVGGAGCALPAGAHRAGARLEARIVDDATGAPVAARVAITDAAGAAVETHGVHPHVTHLGKRWCYAEGTLAADLPEPGVVVEIRHGLETLPLVEKLAVPGGQPRLERTFRLRRWYNRSEAGYQAGDIHAHLPVPAEAMPHLRGEDLDDQVLLHMADSQTELPTNACFTGRLDAHSLPGTEILVGQEIREWHLGHLTLLQLKTLVPGYPDMGGGIEYWRSAPHLDLFAAARAAREQGGMVVWSHLCSVPGAGSPVLAALGLLDAVELVTWNDPTQLPNHLSPWLESGFSQAELPIMRALDFYYTLLNAGFRLPVAAGTDKFGEDIPLGSNRTYAQAEPRSGLDGWLNAVRAGRTFVTNGPIIEFAADGLTPGDVVRLDQPRDVRLRARARSIVQFSTLELVLNGRVIAHRVVYDLPARDGLYEMEIEATVNLAESSWVAARVAEHPDIRRYVLPRGLSVFAHTSPVYFLQGDRPVREAAARAYLQKYVQGLLHWLDGKPGFRSEADRLSTRAAAEEALAALQ